MRALLASTSILALAVIASTQPAMAQRSISTAITTGVDTATATNGGPDNIVITSAGSVKPASGAAVTVNSANTVNNQGTIQITGADNSDGILITTGGPTTITNSGSIILDENYTPTDTDNDGDLDGPFAQGSNRFGIRSTGALTGSIVNTGTITIEGNDSGGIKLGGPLTGSLNSSGTITVTGDRSIGIQTGDVSGDVLVSGAVTATGANSLGLAIDGDVGGKVVIQGSINATGYRYTAPPADTSKLDADDLLQGGGAVRITGNVAGGILLDIPPTLDSSNPDVDGDGIPDASEGSASVVSYGAAPAIAIGGASDITIGGVSGAANGEGLVIKGNVLGAGLYDGVDAVAIQVGGMGGAVDLSGGISISGSVTANNYQSGTATALLVGSGATMNGITISGVLTGSAGQDGTARGVVIMGGANVATLTNSGTLRATVGNDGSAIAIRDLSGTLTLIDNSGTISAAASNDTAGDVIAIDVSANTGGVTIRNANTAATGTPSIVGGIRFGSGSDLLDIERGNVTGNVAFGAGDNHLTLANGGNLVGNVTFGAGADVVALTGVSYINGSIDFGGGADALSLGTGTRFTGGISGGSGLAATVNGTLQLTGTAPVALGSLTVGSTGIVGITIDSTTGTATRLDVAGAASFAAGSSFAVSLDSVSTATNHYVIVQAGTLTGGGNVALNADALPFLFKGSLAADATAGTITLDVSRKTATDLGFNRSQTSAYDSVFAVIDQDANLKNAFLAATSADQIRNYFSSFLPEHSGGLFQNASLASRAAARSLEDRPVGYGFGAKRVSLILNSVVWSASKSTGQTAAYDISGWGAIGGLELPFGGLGRIGATFGIYLGLDKDTDNFNSIETSQYEAAVHWRLQSGGLSTLVRAAYARVSFNSQRVFEIADSTDTTLNFRRASDASWGGNLFSLTGAVAYEIRTGGRFSIKPRVSGDYYRLSEGAYTESGGGAAFDLSVDKRTSDEAAVEGSVVLGYDLQKAKAKGDGYLRLELEGGQRTILSGSMGTTTARFGTGNPFTLSAEDRTDGWLGRIRLMGGASGFSYGGEAAAENQGGNVNLSFRLGVQVGW